MGDNKAANEADYIHGGGKGTWTLRGHDPEDYPAYGRRSANHLACIRIVGIPTYSE